MAYASLPCHRGCISNSQPSAGSHDDAIGCTLPQSTKIFCSSKNIPFSTRSQNPAASGGDDVFKSIVQRWREIEGSVKADLEGSGELHQIARALDVNCSCRVKRTDHKAACPELTSVEKIFPDQRKLVIAIHEIACAGPEEHIDGKTAALDSGLDEAVTWRQTVFAECGA